VIIVQGSADADKFKRAQPHCSTCHRNSNQLTNRGVALKACPNCHLVHNCDACSDSHSKEVCTTYQTQNKIEEFRHQLFEDTGKASVIECTKTPRSKHKSLASCAGWYDYYANISDKSFIQGNILSDFSAISSSAAQRDAAMREFEERRRMFLLMATDTLTMPLTVLSAMEELQLLDTPTLHVHLLGATGREFLAMSTFEEILHLVPGVKSLNITAIGPSSLLFGQHSDGYAPEQELPCCNACQSRGRTRPIASYQGLYHDFAKSRHYQKPDLIVAFNSGCVDGDDADTDWVKTLRFVVESGASALFTTYNPREALHEHAKWTSLGAKFAAEPAKNKWCSLVPMPEFLDEEYDIWYQNYYRYIIKGKSRG